MISRAVSGTILMIPTLLMLYSIGLSALHEPAFGTMIESIDVAQSASATTASAVATKASHPDNPPRPAMIERCHAAAGHIPGQACTAPRNRL